MRDLEEAIARSTQDERDRLDKALRRPKREEEQEEEAEQEEDEDEEKKEEFSKMAVLPPISSKVCISIQDWIKFDVSQAHLNFDPYYTYTLVNMTLPSTKFTIVQMGNMLKKKLRNTIWICNCMNCIHRNFKIVGLLS